jgi:hypothetical protein
MIALETLNLFQRVEGLDTNPPLNSLFQTSSKKPAPGPAGPNGHLELALIVLLNFDWSKENKISCTHSSHPERILT